jgi:thiol:disulfide interchange protein DsbC
MYKIFLFLALSLIMLPAQNLHAFAEKGRDCSKCHSLNKDEAATLLKKFDQNIKVLKVTQSRVKCMWEVSLESKAKKGVVYIDFTKKHLFTGSIIDLEEKKVGVSQIPLKDALVLGDKNAKYRIIVFDDPE